LAQPDVDHTTLRGPGDLFSVDGLVAVVTGASSGLGERFARVLAHNGALVVATARRRERLDALAAEIAGITPLAADLGVEADRTALVDRIMERFGRIDVLVNNAGTGTSRRAVDEPIADFRSVLEVNIVALFELSRLAAGHMIPAGGGSIVNLSSIFGLVASSPIPNGSYCASKGAVISLTRELACQWARDRVRVNALAPGFFPSEAMADMIADPEATTFMKRNCPMGRYGTVGELDGALLFLASAASSYCTGHVLTVDGGWTAR
jgi:NAD(P)-dependent dehydrogenase (short-subunit alcohol dehydrogenase family)